MKKFIFRFETVLKIRKIEMEQQAKVLAEVRQAVVKVRSEMTECRKLQEEEIKRVKALCEKGEFSVPLAKVSIFFRESLRQKEQLKMKEMGELMQKAEQERIKLVEKEKKKKVLDKLKERDAENHDETYRKMETKEMDELASNRWKSPDR